MKKGEKYEIKHKNKCTTIQSTHNNYSIKDQKVIKFSIFFERKKFKTLLTFVQKILVIN